MLHSKDKTSCHNILDKKKRIVLRQISTNIADKLIRVPYNGFHYQTLVALEEKTNKWLSASRHNMRCISFSNINNIQKLLINNKIQEAIEQIHITNQHINQKYKIKLEDIQLPEKHYPSINCSCVEISQDHNIELNLKEIYPFMHPNSSNIMLSHNPALGITNNTPLNENVLIP